LVPDVSRAATREDHVVLEAQEPAVTVLPVRVSRSVNAAVLDVLVT
jgi:hypothetical protein